MSLTQHGCLNERWESAHAQIKLINFNPLTLNFQVSILCSLSPLHIRVLMSRSVSFVDRLELEFPGNHFCHALTLGDVDGDGVSD